MTWTEEVDAFDASLALGAEGVVREFNQSGILATSDVHVALRLARLSGTADVAVQLGAALAARAPRLGHVCVDLSSISDTASTDTDTPADIGALAWPDPAEWALRMAGSPLVGDGRPLHLEGTVLYLDRLWADERQVASDLLERASRPADDVDTELLASGLASLFDADLVPDFQRMAAATAVLRSVSVVAGGPGTGKTTTVAKVLALLEAQAMASDRRAPLVALAAPTGKAARGLEEAVRSGVAGMDLEQGCGSAWARCRARRCIDCWVQPGNRTVSDTIG